MPAPGIIEHVVHYGPVATVSRNKNTTTSVMIKNLIGNYKKRRLDEVKNPTPAADDQSQNKRTAAVVGNNSNTSSILFHCREGSVTHYYHFFFGALVPLIEYHLANPLKVLRILTDVGPFKLILCELPLTISELRGPNLALQGHFHDDKSLNQTKQLGEVSLKGYDCFNNDFFAIPHFPKPPKDTIQAIIQFFNESVPFYIRELPTYDVLLIERAQDVYYQRGGCADRDLIYQTSGSERRSITNHEDLAAAISTECCHSGQTFRNISLERTSIYYQYHMFSKAKVVIAQHGAALSNIFFMASPANKEKQSAQESLTPTQLAAVIEISPPWSRQFEHFKNLATYCEVNYRSVTQERDHSEVNIPAVVELVRTFLQVKSTT